MKLLRMTFAMFFFTLSGCAVTCLYAPKEPEVVFGNSFPKFTDGLMIVADPQERIEADPFLD